MSIPSPRPADYLLDRLRHLTDLRARTQGELVDRLTTIDALDQRIDAAIGELADARRPAGA